MNLAHTFGEGGPEIEMLLLAVALLFLGVTFFIQKTTKPAVPVVLLIAAVAVGAGSFAVGASAPNEHSNSAGAVGAPEGAAVSITSPADGDTVPAGEPVELTVELTGAELIEETESDDPTEGHLHIFVDDRIISMPSTTTNEVELEPGDHTIAVEFTTADHRSFDPSIQDEISVTAE